MPFGQISELLKPIRPAINSAGVQALENDSFVIMDTRLRGDTCPALEDLSEGQRKVLCWLQESGYKPALEKRTLSDGELSSSWVIVARTSCRRLQV